MSIIRTYLENQLFKLDSKKQITDSKVSFDEFGIWRFGIWNLAEVSDF
jgi:hypothetical protein